MAFDFLKRKPKEVSISEIGQSSRDNANRFSGPDAAYQPNPAEVVKPVEHDPGATFLGKEAIIDVKINGRFEVRDEDRENPYFWRGVAGQLNEESMHKPNNEAISMALKLAREIAIVTQKKADGQLGPQGIDIGPTVDQIVSAIGKRMAA